MTVREETLREKNSNPGHRELPASGPSALKLSGTRRAEAALLRKAPNAVNDRIQSEKWCPLI